MMRLDAGICTEFATEHRQLAYAMPGEHEDPLARVSERVIRYADRKAIKPQPR